MTKKDYILIADVIHRIQLSDGDKWMLVDALMHTFKTQNHKFDSYVFLRACGIKAFND